METVMAEASTRTVATAVEIRVAATETAAADGNIRAARPRRLSHSRITVRSANRPSGSRHRSQSTRDAVTETAVETATAKTSTRTAVFIALRRSITGGSDLCTTLRSGAAEGSRRGRSVNRKSTSETPSARRSRTNKRQTAARTLRSLRIATTIKIT